MATIAELFTRALRFHQGGDLRQAEPIYREILQADPGHAEACHLLGLVGYQTGHHEAAIELMGRAIALHPSAAIFHSNLGLVFKDRGQLDEAVACYRRALQLDPRCADALSHLGVAVKEQGHLEEAIECFREALRLNPRHANAHNNLGTALWDQGQKEEALASYQQALRLNPGLVEAHNNLGSALRELGQLEEAAASLHRALRLQPNHAGALCNLGVVLSLQGQLAEAVASLDQALLLRPHYPEAHHNRGLVLLEQGKQEEAVASLQQALRLQPNYAGAHQSLGLVLLEQGKWAEAEASVRQALELQPALAGAHNTLGNIHLEQGRLEEAAACFRRALDLQPDFPDAHNNLGNVLKDMGLLDEALASFRRALDLRPTSAPFHSNLVFTLHFHPDWTPGKLAEEHRLWSARHAEPLAARIRPHANDPDPDRRLRVGYLSPDFRNHPVGRFFQALLEAHQPRLVETFCYAAAAGSGALTQQLRARADHWREVVGLTDTALAELIREDRIDILVDLAAHTARNRLLVFALKPAPVQVTYLAYCSTTGLRTINYRLTDPYLDPPGQAETFYTEESIWLPETYWCYRPPVGVPPPGPLPARSRGRITFGCLNNFGKVTRSALAAWRDLLQTVPGSRLLLHAHTGSHLDRVRRFFAAGDVDPGRIEFVGFAPLAEYFRLYERIDIGLDPFPYAGGTTTCDALWMGVPVVSLAGATAVSRAGLSLLSNAGLTELVARTPTEYVRLAGELARDLPRLADLRGGLRARLEQAPLTDAPRFAAHVEAAFRAMWRRWCASQTHVV